MSTKKIIWIHFLSFMILSTVLFFSAEKILTTYLPDEHNVILWMGLIIYGTLFLFLLTLLSLGSILIYRKIKNRLNQP
jgi:hypothetical protein